MTKQQGGTAHDLFARYFPGDPYTTTFEPTAVQTVNVTRHAQRQATNGDELKAFMQALGLMSYDSKSTERVITGQCKRGHDRAVHAKVRADGFVECRLCKRLMAQARERKA
ncbi:hypothetical protein [Curtobacterium sp. SORGH_AS_0776]|uniref:hypothetical protein n=1 Tax=Curtobacterium sp. SORGH_AS_0776 TaxID=3041798 RepID=UPI00285E24A5|nr:hypothetical protein [Curtobacterium sp. SORGH_AS_0776]MDR6172611.1 hypothetical protein [Curtobacterium sp. SORGH_AS_0776]